jgi:hypothetical protein
MSNLADQLCLQHLGPRKGTPWWRSYVHKSVLQKRTSIGGQWGLPAAEEEAGL